MYKCLIMWRDLTDRHLYQAGDPFPFDGREIPAERIESLVSGKNRAGIAFIRPSEDKAKEEPAKAAGTPKKSTRSRKKTS